MRRLQGTVGFLTTYIVLKWVRALRESHTWVSIVRPPRDHQLVITRPQRVVLLGVSVLASFAVSATKLSAGNDTLQLVANAIIANLVMQPFEIIIPQLFILANTYKSKHNMLVGDLSMSPLLASLKGVAIAQAGGKRAVGRHNLSSVLRHKTPPGSQPPSTGRWSKFRMLLRWRGKRHPTSDSDGSVSMPRSPAPIVGSNSSSAVILAPSPAVTVDTVLSPSSQLHLHSPSPQQRMTRWMRFRKLFQLSPKPRVLPSDTAFDTLPNNSPAGTAPPATLPVDAASTPIVDTQGPVFSQETFVQAFRATGSLSVDESSPARERSGGRSSLVVEDVGESLEKPLRFLDRFSQRHGARQVLQHLTVSKQLRGISSGHGTKRKSRLTPNAPPRLPVLKVELPMALPNAVLTARGEPGGGATTFARLNTAGSGVTRSNLLRPAWPMGPARPMENPGVRSNPRSAAKTSRMSSSHAFFGALTEGFMHLSGVSAAELPVSAVDGGGVDDKNATPRCSGSDADSQHEQPQLPFPPLSVAHEEDDKASSSDSENDDDLAEIDLDLIDAQLIMSPTRLALTFMEQQSRTVPQRMVAFLRELWRFSTVHVLALMEIFIGCMVTVVGVFTVMLNAGAPGGRVQRTQWYSVLLGVAIMTAAACAARQSYKHKPRAAMLCWIISVLLELLALLLLSLNEEPLPVGPVAIITATHSVLLLLVAVSVAWINVMRRATLRSHMAQLMNSERSGGGKLHEGAVRGGVSRRNPAKTKQRIVNAIQCVAVHLAAVCVCVCCVCTPV